MSTSFDVTKAKKVSTAKPISREQAARLEAKEFIDAILAYPIKWEFSLWNLQGEWGMRTSCKRRGKVPADLQFEHEIELAKKLGWLEEGEEDFDFTERYQVLYKDRPIGYGRQFVRLAKSSQIRQQSKRFLELYVKKATDRMKVAAPRAVPSV